MNGETGSRPVEVAVIGADYPDSFAEIVTAALIDAGVRATLVDPQARYVRSGTMARFSKGSRYLDEAVKRMGRLRQVLIDGPVSSNLRQLQPQLVLSTSGYLEPEQVEAWRGAAPDATWALWYPDAVTNLGRQQMLDAPYDHLFFKDEYIVDHLRRRTGLSTHLLAEACYPARHRAEEFASAEEEAQFKCDVAVVGNIYPYRALILDAIPSHVDMRVYGNLQPHVAARRPHLQAAFSGEYVTGRRKALAFKGAKIVLNTMHFGEVRGTNARLFEATGCGGFVLTHSIPGLEEYFEPGKEVATFDTRKDLCTALEQYLTADSERRSMAEAGRARAHRDHTYIMRFERMFQVCGTAHLLSGL